MGRFLFQHTGLADTETGLYEQFWHGTVPLHGVISHKRTHKKHGQKERKNNVLQPPSNRPPPEGLLGF